MSFQDDLVVFLRTSREVKYLNFEAFGFAFSPGQYGIVADRIEDGTIRVRQSRVLPLSRDAAASWKTELNEFWFRPEADLGSDYWRALTAHEATHCVHDILNPGLIETAVVESIGYIAEAIALYAQGNNPIGLKGGSGVDPMRAAAMGVVTANWNTAGGILRVGAADAETLRAVVAAHPHTISQGPRLKMAGLSR